MQYCNPKVYDPPLGKAHYRHFQMPPEWEPHIKRIIGKDGCNFIKATKQSGCLYIWHHQDTNMIEIWGPLNRVEKGEKRVREIAQYYIKDGTSCDEGSQSD